MVEYWELEDMTTEEVEDKVYLSALKSGDFALAYEANQELYERVYNGHSSLIEERDKRLKSGVNVEGILKSIKALNRIMYGLRITGMSLAELYNNNGKEEA